jgi:hypothetical protein
MLLFGTYGAASMMRPVKGAVEYIASLALASMAEQPVLVALSKDHYACDDHCLPVYLHRDSVKAAAGHLQMA